MLPFTFVRGPAMPLLQDNIDTDTIIRIERMTGTPKDGMGQWAFESLRILADGSRDMGCVLNKPAFEAAPILLAGANFGCGSSREAAVWALMGAGLRCVIASSFSEIFSANCFQNGLLPVVLHRDHIQLLARFCGTGAALCVDLHRQLVDAPDTHSFDFDIDQRRRAALLEGLDDIAQTSSQQASIDAFQAHDRLARPWIWLEPR